MRRGGTLWSVAGSIGAVLALAGCQGPKNLPSASMSAATHSGGPVVFFAPHPDDETFCCAATILHALAERKRVHIVIFTNGDGWPRATAAYTKKSEDALTPADYLEIARVRQHETLAALGELGLSRELKPQRLYVTHDADTHLDHQAAFWFVRDAATAVNYRGEVHTYVNHYDSYPCPSTLPCPVPVRLVPSETHAATKLKALLRYQSQVWHFFGSEHSLKLRAAAPELYWPVDPQSFAALPR